MPNHNLELKQLNSSQPDFLTKLDELLNRQQDHTHESSLEQQVADIIRTVRCHGDQAVVDYTQRFDGFDLKKTALEVPKQRLQEALASISKEQKRALEYAAQRIKAYHQHQLQESWHYQEIDGTILGQKINPIKRVGLYVPGGKAAYPSSVLMNAIPAKVAGVKELIMVSPTPKGEVNEMVLAAALIAGVDSVLRIGGAHAIAALSYGTESISAVDKIVGPGNQYVATAKKQVFGDVGIDMIAGPSEVLIVADDSVNPDWVAMDMFAQAEHDEMAQAILLTADAKVAEAVARSIEKLLPSMERADIIQQSLINNGALILLNSKQELIDNIDKIAPEHLQLFHQDADQLAQQISNAGAIFIGAYSAESLGDYCAGPNHVLPTSGTARFSSPLGVYDFQKRSSMIKVSPQGAQTIGQQASVLARAESLTAHARSAEYRLDKNTIKNG